MRVLVVSDIHGNLPALEYVLEKEKNADLVISLGDVVNYGPWSNECVELLETLPNKILIAGNHEEAFIKGVYPGSNPVSKAFFLFCYPTFHLKDTISKYIQHYRYSGFDFIHTLDNRYIFPDSEVSLSSNTFIGHSHRIFSRVIGNFKLVNAGSVGQNRTNLDELNYVVWIPEDDKIDLVTKEFNADFLVDKMKQSGYPEICLNYILSKRKI